MDHPNNIGAMRKGFWIVFILFLFVASNDGKSYEEDLLLTSEEKIKLDQFKAIMSSRLPKEYMKEEVYLMRWLRARYFNMIEAEKMLMGHIKWWKENRMDTIHDEDWKDMKDEGRYWTEGRDKEGRPVLYIRVGDWDLRKQIISGRQERFLRYVDRGLDEVCGIVRELGVKYENVSQGVLLLNTDGFSLSEHACLQCIPLLLRIIFSYEAHYPGCAEKIIAINVPIAAEFIVQTARNALHPETNKAVQIYGTNRLVWKPVLNTYFEWNELPPEVGGTKLYEGMELDY